LFAHDVIVAETFGESTILLPSLGHVPTACAAQRSQTAPDRIKTESKVMVSVGHAWKSPDGIQIVAKALESQYLQRSNHPPYLAFPARQQLLLFLFVHARQA
jgi:hypothetical protein